VPGAFDVHPTGARTVELRTVGAAQVDERGRALEGGLQVGRGALAAVGEVELDDLRDRRIGVEARPHPSPERARGAGEDNGGHRSTMPV